MRNAPYCGLCCDTGLVTVVHPKAVAAARHDFAEFMDHGTINSAGVMCGCRYGERWQGVEKLQVYDRTKHCLWSDPDSIEAVRDDGVGLASMAKAALEKRGDEPGDSPALRRKLRLASWIDAHRGDQYAFNPDADVPEDAFT